MKITAQDIRDRLPGLEINTTLIDDGRGNKIIWKSFIRGCFNTLENVTCFLLYCDHQFTSSFNTIEEARKGWENNVDNYKWDGKI